MKHDGGDIEKKFIETHEAYSDAIFRFCFFKISDRDKAYDLAQETFVRLWNYIRDGEKTIDNERAFLYKIARNLIIDEYRKKDSMSLDTLQEGGFDVSSGGEKDIEMDVSTREVVEAIHKLDDLYCEVALLRFVEGYPPREIAEMLSVSENVVSVRLNRAVKKLRVMLKVENE
ncbi:MAG: RNA polymerase sigma factor [Candidatus Campbellbacteria bacterium]|nr:RNA polymerase sigma factor [Candidatus Campbellbacteria bacterium]